MINKFFKILKKIVMAIILIFAYNKISISLNATIPINFITITLATIFGIPALFFLVVFYLIIL